MKKLAILFLLATSAFGACGGWTNGYSFCRTVTIDHTKVPNTDQTNFPVGFQGTYAYLATVANGGNVQSSTGLDILFTSDTAGATVLNFERVNYAQTTGTVEFWIQVPTVSHTVDTVIYLYYGKAGVSDPSNATFWGAIGYHLVIHHGSATTLAITDSSGSGNNGTLPGTTHNPTNGTGTFGGAGTFVNTSQQYYTTGNPFPGGTTTATTEAWVNLTNDADYQMIFDPRLSSMSVGLNLLMDPSSHPYMFCNGLTTITGSATINGAWHLVSGTQTNTTGTLFSDGVSQGTTSGNCSLGGGSPHIGFAVDLVNYPLKGLVDEVRVLIGAALTSDWMTTEFNNITTSTFYTIGSAVSGTIPSQFPRVQ